VPPPNASRLIRHHFDDDRLVKYITDFGGDSVAMFKILEEKFFVCKTRKRDPFAISCPTLQKVKIYEGVLDLLQEGPGLVSKFEVPQNFVCSPPSNELKKNTARPCFVQKLGRDSCAFDAPWCCSFHSVE
jgi:hypothetical protein